MQIQILTSCNIVVTVSHKLELLSLEGDLGSIELRVEQVDLLLAEALTIVLVLVLLSVDVVANIVNLALPLFNGRVELHGLLGCMSQVLLEVGDLAG